MDMYYYSDCITLLFQEKWLSLLEETRQRFKIQLQKEVSAQSQITHEQYEKEKNPFYESGKNRILYRSGCRMTIFVANFQCFRAENI